MYSMQTVEAIPVCDSDVIHSTKASPGNDPLIVEKRPTTRSLAKMLKEVMGLLAQVTVDEILIMASKETSFMLDSEEETRQINLFQAMKNGAEELAYATPQCIYTGGRIQTYRDQRLRFVLVYVTALINSIQPHRLKKRIEFTVRKSVDNGLFNRKEAKLQL